MTLTDRESSSSPSEASSEAGSSTSSETSNPSNPAVSDSDQDDVVDPVCLEWFKDVIKKIKGQKQRPGLDRMTQALKPYITGTKYDSQSIKKQLALAIRDGHLFKVYSNGEPSYKDTQNLRSLRKLVIKKEADLKRAAKAAVREIGEKDGTDPETIERYIKYTFEVKLEAETLKSGIAKALHHLTTSKSKDLIEQDGRYKHNPKSDTKADEEEDDAEGSRPRSSLSATPRLKDNSEEIPLPTAIAKTKSKSKMTKSAEAADLPAKQLSTPAALSGSKRSSASASPSKTTTPDTPLKRADLLPAERHKSSTPKLDNSLKRKKSQSPEKKSDKLLTPSSSKPPKISPEVKEKAKASQPTLPLKSQEATAVPVVEKKKRGRPPLKKKAELAALEASAAGAKSKSAEKAKEEVKGKSQEESSGDSQADEKTAAIFPDADFDDRVPKELRDGLSSYFSLSTVKRKSRVAYNSLVTAVVPPTKDGDISQDNEPKPSTSRQKSPPASRQSLPSTSKSPSAPTVWRKKLPSISGQRAPPDGRAKSPEDKPSTSREKADWDTLTDSGSDARVKSESQEGAADGIKKKKGKKPGSYQLKGLSDQLSKYFTAPPGARQRKPPAHYTPIADKYPKQKVRKAAESTTASDRSESRSGKVSDDGRTSKSTSKTKDMSERSIRVDSPGKEGFRIPDVVPKHFEDLFRQARMKALEKIPTVSADYEGSLPPKIQLGNKKIVTWYTSPFPEEYIRCQCLYLCEFCLQYMKTVKVLKSHYEKCPWHRPPGTEIYHDVVEGEDGEGRRQELVLYETDGNEWKEYCQNLCLLAKLYLDHKTLYYDVEPFLFYVLTSRDKFGDHLIGYFSKEKNCPQRYNVSCIMVLPPYQGGGYGRFLIDFSYLLSRVEGQHGTPEKPLSELGQISYHAYWRSAILDFFLEQRQKSSTKTSIKAICDATGMWPQDVADILQQLNFLVKKEDSNAWEFSLVPDVLDAYFERKNSAKKRLPLHADKLNWDPWRGEGMGLTSGESDHGESQTDMQLDTHDEAKDGHRSRDTSQSDTSQGRWLT
ncbi:hypothetical protein RvY_13962-2 [Ramazzottius varieornatus]|uniref:histone acetyltransferase n=1 Tax=Ramazzottius varieornatus TaxID=947166 RepID=A0A1D1VRG2_RAMVA|nr:hypothetical protein RvY_13962-2 [Ramazzottius varieornatus]